jgi:hypothetical protein
MDSILILLTPEWRDAFVQWTPTDSAVSPAVMTAADISHIMRNTPYRFMVKCDEAAAYDLQQIAVEHCPAALGEIREALRARGK